MGERPRIALMTEQYDRVISGPGTFARYVRDAVLRGEVDVSFHSDDMAAPARDWERPVPLPVRLPSPPGAFVRQAAFARSFARDHRARPYDVLWYNTAVTGWWSAVSRRRVPLVLMVNDYYSALAAHPRRAVRTYGAYRAMTRGFWRPFERAALLRADRVVVNSRFMADELEQAYGLRPERVRVLHKAVDAAAFRPPPQGRGIEGGLVRILFVKTDYSLGGLADLLAALAEARFESTLTVVGPPPGEWPAIRKLARAARFRGGLVLAGCVSREALPALFAEHDLLCVPSRAEAFGVVFLEALAAGLPAVGTRVGGIPEAVDFGRGAWLAPPADPVGLARTLEAAVSDAGARVEKVRHGLDHARTFTPARMVGEMLAIARELA